MHHKLLEEATHEQLKAFASHEFDRLREFDKDLYQEMECDLYMAVHGPHFTQWKYEKAVEALDNANGTKGPHWTVSDITSYAKSRGLTYANFNEYDFAYAMNMAYSDYYGVIPDSVDGYFKVAKAFIEDKDAPEGKAFLYWKAMCH